MYEFVSCSSFSFNTTSLARIGVNSIFNNSLIWLNSTIMFRLFAHLKTFTHLKKHKRRRYTVNFGQRQTNFSQGQKYNNGWRSSWKHILLPWPPKKGSFYHKCHLFLRKRSSCLRPRVTSCSSLAPKSIPLW